LNIDNKNTILFVDLDDTLVDTSSFKRALFLSLSEYFKISFKKVERLYFESKDFGYENLSFRFCRKIAGRSKKRIENYWSIFSLEIERMKVKRKVVDYLKSFQGYKVLLTLGDRKIQEEKIKVLRDKIDLDKIVDEVKIINGSKQEYIKSLIREDKLSFAGRQFAKVLILDDKNYLFDDLKDFWWIELLDPRKL